MARKLTQPDMVRLHALPGLARLHIGEHDHEVAADGTVIVPDHQAEAAISLGCSRLPPTPAEGGPDPFAALVARVEALEAELADLRGKRK